MVRQDLLSRFTHLSSMGEEKLTDKTLRDIILNFIIAGRDTSAVTLTWFFYMMSCHPEVADKVFEEVCSIEQPNSGAQGRILHQYVAFCTTWLIGLIHIVDFFTASFLHF
jgi:cytochrome P450